MKDLYIDNYGKTSQRLSAEDSSFVHYLWVNFDPNNPKYKDVIPEDIRSIPNLQITNIREFEGHPLYHNTVDFLENGRAASKFVEASDLVRVMATEAKGGLYHDLDWKLYDAKEMIKYMKNFYFIGGREGEEWTSSIGNAMFAAKAEHPVVKKLSQLIDRNLNEKNPELLPDYIKYPQREFDRIISSSGPIAITMAYNLAGNKDENRDLVCPSKVLYNADYARSHQTGDHHNPQELKHSWQMIPIKTIGGDQFSGNWGHSYQEPIKYNRNDLRVKGQKELCDELNKEVEQDNKEMFDALFPRITKQQSLDYSLNVAYDIPAIGDKSQGTENQVTQTSNERLVDTINHKIFMGTTALAVVMKALGQDIDWAKPILGGGAAKVEPSFEPIDLEAHMKPDYDYSSLLKAEIKKASPLEKTALERVAELAQSEEASNLS